MPRFSVIVPVYKVQGYLRECLDSVLGQSHRDLEVIAVDDCSPDGCGRILDEYAARDARLSVLHLTHNIGLGPARNTGADRATGDYLLFLDSDDSYCPGALEAMAQRLAECGDPDVLVFDHVRSYWWNGTRPSVFGEQLAAPGSRTGNAHTDPDLLRLFAVAWNKAFRRAFYQHQGFAFRPGLYEDAPLAYEAMASAGTIGCLPRACVRYRQRPQGAITSSPGRRHFDIFPQYASLFAFLDDRPELDELRPLLFERMISHFLFCVVRTDRVRPGDRRAYFRTAMRYYREYRPAGHRPPPGGQGLRHRLLATGSYGGFALLEARRRLRARLRGLARRTRAGVGRRVYRAYYRFQCALPIDPNLAVYSSFWDRGVLDNPAAVQRACAELAPQIHSVWVVRRQLVPQLPAGTDYVLPRSRRYWWSLARARYLVNNVNFPTTIRKRAGQVYVQTHHGTPLKSMGLDQQPYAVTRMDFRALLHRVSRWDFSITSNPHSAEVWDRAYPGSYEHLETGYPRNDRYFTASRADVLDARKDLGVPAERIALLYAPTMRDYRNGFTPQLDLARLSRQLGDRFVLLVRTHYFYGSHPGLDEGRELRELQDAGRLLDVSAHPDVTELCLVADGLITDYSSVMFDYAALDRPILIHAPDWDTYRDTRGVYFDLLSGRPGLTPGVVARDTDELVAALRSGRWRDAEAAELRAAFREVFCAYDDGLAAERVVRRVFLGTEARDLPPVRPLTERTPAPAVHPARVAASAAPAAPTALTAPAVLTVHPPVVP